MIQRMIPVFVISALFALCGCGRCPEASGVTNAVEADNPLVSGQHKLTNKEKAMIYSALLGEIYHEGNRPLLSGDRITGDLVYRVTTTNTVDITRLENSERVAKILLTSFRFENRKPDRIPAGKLSIWPVFPFDKPNEVQQLFYSAKESRRRQTEAAVVLSNIGFNPVKNKGLVYAEYFNERTGVLKYWIEFELFGSPYESNQRFTGVTSVYLTTADRFTEN